MNLTDERHENVQGTQSRAAPVHSEAGHADQRPAGLETGVWRHGEGGVTNRSVGREEQVHSRMDDICYTMFQVPMETRTDAPNPLPIPPRSCSSHSPRTHGMVADRRGRGQGSAALLQLPTLAF